MVGTTKKLRISIRQTLSKKKKIIILFNRDQFTNIENVKNQEKHKPGGPRPYLAQDVLWVARMRGSVQQYKLELFFPI